MISIEIAELILHANSLPDRQFDFHLLSRELLYMQPVHIFFSSMWFLIESCIFSFLEDGMFRVRNFVNVMFVHV